MQAAHGGGGTGRDESGLHVDTFEEMLAYRRAMGSAKACSEGRANPGEYDASFFDSQREESLRSARVVVPVVVSLVGPVRSVVDFGCGVGAWLKAFEENGAEDVLGYDGDYVDRDKL